MTKERLIELFKFEEPYISFEYRKKSFAQKRDAICDLLREKLIIQISKNNKTVVYKYLGK